MDKKELDSIIEDYNSLMKKVSTLEDKISDTYTIIAECFETKLDWWDWSNGSREVNGTFSSRFFDNDAGIFEGEAYFKRDSPMIAIIEGGEFDFSCGEFPIDFLFKDFREELLKGIEGYVVAQKERKEKARAKTRERLKSINEAKAKLTAKEKKLLGLT